MKNTQAELWPINQLLIFMAASSVIFMSLKFASGLIVPFFIAASIAIVLSPILDHLEKRHIPKIFSLIVIILLSLIPLAILSGYIAGEAKDLANNFQSISQKFTDNIQKFAQFMHGIGIDIDVSTLDEFFANNNIGAIIKKLASQAGSQFSNIFLIFFTVAFMLMESGYFYNKMIKVAKENGKDIAEWMDIIEKIKSYFLLKAKTSLLTALWVLGVLWFYDVQYFYLWAALAFFLNFIPVIGSILAAVPPVILTFLDQSVVTALWVGLWYLVINIIVGNILEPKIMGQGLKLSSLVIFLSMTFWGWVFGPTGMILSVPLTMITQFLFSQYKETRWIAFVLSDYQEKERIIHVAETEDTADDK